MPALEPNDIGLFEEPVPPRSLDALGAHADEIEAIIKRRTNRNHYQDRPVADALLTAMLRRAASAGAWLKPVPSAARVALADLIAEGDRAQMAYPSFRRELAAWYVTTTVPLGTIVTPACPPGSGLRCSGAGSRVHPNRTMRAHGCGRTMVMLMRTALVP
jgi:hypothetical protein